MKKLIVFLTTFVLAGTMMARQLTPDEALALALGKMNIAKSGSTRAQVASINATSVKLKYTEMSSQDVPLLYVYDIAEGGFIIASADDRASCLLGYTDSGNFDGAKQNKSFMSWLKCCSKTLSRIGIMPEQTRSTMGSTRALSTSVEPLLGEIKWSDGLPYNMLTPMRVGYPFGDDTPITLNAAVGCAATALAQVMKYYEWPVTGTGSHTNENDSTQTIDFSQSNYQWSKMLPTYKFGGNESEESQLAVAQLMRDIGCAVDTEYGLSESFASDDALLRGLTTYFRYDKSMRFMKRTECSSDEWDNLLRTELNEKRPVIMLANELATLNRLYFVVDGYDTNSLYHVNWCWGGFNDGYFDMNLMDPFNQGFGGYDGGYTLNQAVILGVKPDIEGTSEAKPELVMTQQVSIDPQTQQFAYLFSNYGLGDFTGEIGIAMESPTGEVTKVSTEKFADKPIAFFKEFYYLFTPPVAPGPEYMLYPYYSYEIDGEMKRVPAPYIGYSTLYAFEKNGVYNWITDRDETVEIDLDEVKVMHNFVGFDPQLSITVSNSSSSHKEYVGNLYVLINKMVDGEEELVFGGYGMVFIQPGETKEIIVRCKNIADELNEKTEEGEYVYQIYSYVGGHYKFMDSGSFEMVITSPSDISYKDFDINKTEFQPDEELTASMTVVNTGGYDVKTLAFVIFRTSDHSVVDVIELRNVGINAESIETFTFSRSLSYDPDEYVGGFYVNSAQLKEAPTFHFTVGDPTSLDQISSSPGNDAKAGIYDLQGHPLSKPQRGVNIINGKKIRY